MTLPEARLYSPGLTRRRFLLASFGAPLIQGSGGEVLRVRIIGDTLRVSAPRLRLIAGRPLERLRDGASLAFDFQLAALADRPGAGSSSPRVLARILDRFAVSYDLWEEKFSVSRMSHPPRGVSHLDARSAEAWCLEQLPLPAAALPAESPFWLRLEVRVEDSRDRPGLLGEPGINLARLIELFSRPTRGGHPPWLVDDGPFRLNEVRGAAGRGSSAG